MNHDTSKTSRPAAPLDAKPDLVKRIGNQVVGQIVALLIRLIQQHLKFNIRRFIGTAIGRNEQLSIGLVRVLDVVQRLFQR